MFHQKYQNELDIKTEERNILTSKRNNVSINGNCY